MRARLLPLLALLLGAGPALAAAGCGADPELRLVELGSFERPTHVAQAPDSDDRLYVVEQAGTIRILEGGEVRPEPFADLRDSTSEANERGLLSVAFAPDYERSGRLYVHRTNPEGDIEVLELRRSRSDPRRVDPAGERLVIRVRKPRSERDGRAFATHNGGLVAFGPDGMLYVGIGDGGGEADPRDNGQDPSTPHGTILRIDPRPSGGRGHTVPEDNPFVGRPGADEVFVYGLRNPWRFAFDGDDLWIADVGEDEREEVNHLPLREARGANFGWSAYEGTLPFRPERLRGEHTEPAFEYERGGGRCSITGGLVVRDPDLPDLRGGYLWADWCSGELGLLRPGADGELEDREVVADPDPELPSSFGEGNDGTIYLTSTAGPVWRLEAVE